MNQPASVIAGNCPVCLSRERDVLLHVKRHHDYQSLTRAQRRSLYNMIESILRDLD